MMFFLEKINEMAIEKEIIKNNIIETISFLEIYYELISGLEIGEKVCNKKNSEVGMINHKLNIRKSSFDEQMERIKNLKDKLIPLLEKNINSLEVYNHLGISEYKESKIEIEIDEEIKQLNLFH